MLYAQKVAAALAEKRASFAHQEDAFTTTLRAYRAALADLGRQFPTQDALASHLHLTPTVGQGARFIAPASGEQSGRLSASPSSAGAKPTSAYTVWAAAAAPGTLPVVPFGRPFAHHEEARAWAEQAIARTTTIAVDGSQILPWRDVSIPVALVQAGIFVNPHDAAQPYVKDVVVEVLGPEDLAAPADIQDEEEHLRLAAEEIVNLRRFQLETRTLAAWMRAWRPRADQPAPLAILDGSLIVSFALTMPPELRNRYIAAATDLLAASEATRVPLIAYIDTSFARDLTTMLRAAFPDRHLPATHRLHDGMLWGDALAWGDVTLPWISARGDVLAQYGAQSGSVAFTYLQAAAERPPARIEMPRWLVESDQYGRVLDVLRAELVVGNGYPYAIETADAVAVISVADRARFYQMFQHFAAESDLPLSFSRKTLSKSRRR
jgi:hypothetical protein